MAFRHRLFREAYYHLLVHLLQKLVLSLPLLALGLQAQTLTITHAKVINTVDGGIQSDTTVVIQGNRIIKVVPTASLKSKDWTGH